MPRQNRVTPRGDLIAVADRGMFWGNRGLLHDAGGRLVRYSRGRAWAICVLEYKGRRRTQWARRARGGYAAGWRGWGQMVMARPSRAVSWMARCWRASMSADM